MNQPWLQNFDPLGNPWLSTLAAAVPVCTLFFFLAVRRAPAAWRAAVYAFIAALLIALVVFRMPPVMVAGAVADGMVFGWFRIAWIVVAAVFVYDISVESGQFEIVKQSIGDISDDRRLQVLLIAFAFGALLEGAGGGGAPVAVSGAMMIGLGFPPFQTAMLCLIANSAPVAYGGLGNPVRTLVAVTGLGEADFSAMIGRILPLTTLVLPFWLVRVFCNRRSTWEVWPGLLACGISFGGIQFFWSNYMNASLVDIMGGIGTLVLLAVFFKYVWRPKTSWRYEGEGDAVKLSEASTAHAGPHRAGLVTLPAAGRVRRALGDTLGEQVPGQGLLQATGAGAAHAGGPNPRRSWPKPTPSPPCSTFRGCLIAGTGTLLAGLIAGPLAGLSFKRTLKVFRGSFARLKMSLVAIMAMLGVGYVTRYCGMDATMGMAAWHLTGVLFPFSGTAIGWLGVSLSGTDAGSNALFGSLQVITANKLGLSPILMGAANSAGGVMGKMMAAQSLVIGCAVTGQEGQEGLLFRAVLKHSLALMVLVGLIVLMYAYVFPGAIPSGHQFWK